MTATHEKILRIRNASFSVLQKTNAVHVRFEVGLVWSTNYCLCYPLMLITVMVQKKSQLISFGSTEVIVLRGRGDNSKVEVTKVSVKPINCHLFFPLTFAA
jgi:hypothetical protein